MNLPNNKKWGDFSILMWNGETAVYGASEVEINFAQDCFHAFVSRVVAWKGPSYSLVNTEVYLAVCSLQGYQMDFETGMITIPAENMSFRVIGSKKGSKEIEPITSVKVICKGFRKRPKVEEVETSKAVEKKEEKKEEERVDFLGFLCEVD